MKTKPLLLLLMVSMVFLNTSCKKTSEQHYVFVIEEGTLSDKAGMYSSTPQDVEKIYPGVKVKMTYNPTSHSIKFENFDIYFTSDNFETIDGATGGSQLIRFSIYDFEASLDISSGKISGNNDVCYYIQAAELMGGKGLLCVGNIDIPESIIKDKNSSSFDLTNGLGCNGRLKVSLFFGNGIPPMNLRLDAKLLEEDIDGDNIFDTSCTPPKEFQVLYDPPKINVILPGPIYRAQYGDIYTMQFFKIDELLKSDSPRVLADTTENKMMNLTFDNSSSVQILIFDAYKNIVKGNLTDSATKSFTLEINEEKDYFIGIIPFMPLSEGSFYNFP